MYEKKYNKRAKIREENEKCGWINRKKMLLYLLKQGYRNPTGVRRWVKVAKNQKLLYTHGMGPWRSKNRHKYLLQYHIIFVCKYRKKLLVSRQISDDIKQFSYEICQRHSVIIRYMETDKDHIHYMIETEPTMSK